MNAAGGRVTPKRKFQVDVTVWVQAIDNIEAEALVREHLQRMEGVSHRVHPESIYEVAS